MAEDRTVARAEAFDAQVESPLRAFIRTESAGAGLLVVAVAVALLWANSPWSDSYERLWHTVLEVRIGSGEITMDLRHWVNDGLMVVFFFVVGLEVRREFSIGQLTDRRRIVVPVVAGIGGMVVPAGLYLALNPSGEAMHGWGAVIGTDTAFLLGALALVGPTVSTQLRIFLLTLSVFDDIVAVSVIGVFYTDSIAITPLVVAVGCLAALALLGRLGEWRASPYVVVVVVLWIATLESGLHASIAGMLAGLLVPAQDPDRRLVESATRQFRAFRQSPMPEVQRTARQALSRAVSVNERLQEVLHGWTSFVVVPVFALANAGVDLRGGALADALTSRVTWGVVVGLVLGKLVGITAGSFLAVRLRLGETPQGVGWGHIVAGSALSGIGFTISLLIVGLAFDSDELRAEATTGVLLAAALATGLGWIAFRAAAAFLGQENAELPRLLSDPVDPRRDHIRGRVDAELTLVEYLDYECPFCARATGTAAEVRAHFGDRLRYVARHLPLPVHPHAELAALAVEAAGEQGRFWELHDLLFQHQDGLELEDVAGYAAALGLDVERFLRDIEDERLAERIRRNVASAEASGVRGTPTFFIGDLRHVGPYDAASLISELEGSANPPSGDPLR